MVKQAITDMGPKAVRMSVVALTGAVLTVVWAFVDEFANQAISPILVSSVTALFMLIAQFYDYRASVSGVDLFDGDDE